MANIGTCWKSKCGLMELRCGDYREVLADVDRCDAVITDPPYSIRQSDGYRSGSEKWDKNRKAKKADTQKRVEEGRTSGGYPGSLIPYAPIDKKYTGLLADFVAGKNPKWFFGFGDHVSQGWMEESFDGIGWVTFAPIPWIKRNAPPRFAGDGPQNSSEWILVSRPKGRIDKNRAGSRVGYYICNIENSQSCVKILTGQKPVALMRKIVRDYTLPGDLILEPHCGSGSTLLAAAMEGRRAIGAELDPKTFDLAVKRLSAGYTSDLFGGE